MLDKFALAGIFLVLGFLFGLFVAMVAAKEVLTSALSFIGKKIRGACVAASMAVDRMGEFRRAMFPRFQTAARVVFGKAYPYLRSRTNWAQICQFAGIVLAAPMSAADLEMWSTRAWLLFAAGCFVFGIIFRGPKHGEGPAMGPGAMAGADFPMSEPQSIGGASSLYQPASPRTF
jgi:hypothetical protein